MIEWKDFNKLCCDNFYTEKKERKKLFVCFFLFSPLITKGKSLRKSQTDNLNLRRLHTFENRFLKSIWLKQYRIFRNKFFLILKFVNLAIGYCIFIMNINWQKNNQLISRAEQIFFQIKILGDIAIVPIQLNKRKTEFYAGKI